MILKSFGCSFIWGSDLCKGHWRYSNDVWPALLSQHLGLKYHSYAVPGGGNLCIAEKILGSVNESDTVVVQWTYIDRFDYKTSLDTTWQTIRPANSSDVDRLYYQHLHSQYCDKLHSLILIKTCIDHLKQLNCKFIMTYMDHLLFENQWHISPAVNTLQNYVKPYLKTFNNDNMLEYSQKRGHPISKNNHPLHAAHQDLFLYAKDNFLKDLL